MSVSPEFRDYVLDLLAAAGEVMAKPMFGGYGLYLQGMIFALLHRDTLYLKSDGETRGDFAAAGLQPFTYLAKGKTIELPYHEAPLDALEDPERFTEWLDRALAAARRAEDGRPAKKERGKR